MAAKSPSNKIVVFAYNFPHKKTQDFIFHLMAGGLRPHIVIGTDFQCLNIPPATIHIKPKHVDLLEPREICRQFGLEFISLGHNSDKCLTLLSDLKVDIGIIAGARILKRSVIKLFRKGILNFHPGLLPQARGLDALLWSIYFGHPIGVTAHLINEKIDHGRMVKWSKITEYPSDTLVDLSLRLEEQQNIMLCESVNTVLYSSQDKFEPITDNYPVNKKMDAETESKIPDLLQIRLQGNQA